MSDAKYDQGHKYRLSYTVASSRGQFCPMPVSMRHLEALTNLDGELLLPLDAGPHSCTIPVMQVGERL
jgi:TusA-related sulfurtransferase